MTTAVEIRILGISGSLRAGSFNTATLRAAGELLPAGATLEVARLHGIPMYDADVEAAGGFPPPVAELRERVSDADALLVATPEYNYSIPGVLKNAWDWLTRGPHSPLNGKPMAIVGAGGRLGTVRAQMHLREISLHNNLRVVTSPEVYIDHAWTKFDVDGYLTEERARAQIAGLIGSLVILSHSSLETGNIAVA